MIDDRIVWNLDKLKDFCVDAIFSVFHIFQGDSSCFLQNSRLFPGFIGQNKFQDFQIFQGAVERCI